MNTLSFFINQRTKQKETKRQTNKTLYPSLPPYWGGVERSLYIILYTMKKSFLKPLLLAALAFVTLSSCSDDHDTIPQKEPTYDMTGFAKGADVSWLTQMQASGKKFYNSNGTEQDCMSLLRDLGVNSIRLRVWVDPADGWCNKKDLLTKAWHAKNLGERIMVDFHYSDSWADPGKQNIPAAWNDFKDDLDKMKAAVAEHTTDVLKYLKDNGIDVEWIQIGNETRTGMLWPLGLASDNNFSNYAALNNAGYDAAKAVYPNAQCIIHIDQGNDLGGFTWMIDGLKAAGAKWDVIGMSLYPEDNNWQELTDDCLNNISTLATRYNKKVMICEIGMPWDSENAAAMMQKMVDGCKAKTECLGIFYWEPECYGGWNDYNKGAFDSNGKPTDALNAFGSNVIK